MRIGLTNILGRNDYDGSYKFLTELCKDCEFYRVMNGERRCYWGVAYKILVDERILSYCNLIKKESPRKKSLKEDNSIRKYGRKNIIL